jgi:hypothetical protein
MGSRLGRRLSRLEREVTPAMRDAYVWWECPEEETKEQAIAQQFPDGVPADVRVVLLRWLTPGEASGTNQGAPRNAGAACGQGRDAHPESPGESLRPFRLLASTNPSN